MKKMLLLLALAFMTALATFAQNANRSGFFLEAGVGATVGSTMRSSFSITDDVFTFKCRTGMTVDFGLGYRLRFSPHWAYEFKANAQSNPDNIVNDFVGRALVAGFRYTSVEVWRNFSLYGHFNVGGAIAANRGMIDYGTIHGPLTNDMQNVKIKSFIGDEGFGAAYSLGIGVNVTTHFYVEYCWDAQYMFSCYGKNGKGNLHWGMSGIVLGYRF